ncbi:FtsK/SpoIIIE domain-containing protein (plasmid) [Coraliomargarita sp. W4R53]
MSHTFLAKPPPRAPQPAVPIVGADLLNNTPSDDELDADALTLPSAWAPPVRPPVPVVASLVPLAGAVVLWLVTGSPMMLWFALLGPLIAGGTMLDAARSGRKSQRRADADAQAQRERVGAVVAQLHERERLRLWARHPDVASYLQRDTEIWRAGARRSDALVIGSALVPSGLRVTGGERDPRSVEVRRHAAWIADAPLIVRASDGATAVGSPMLAASVQRAWLLQLCAALPPGELRIVGALKGELEWAEELPHRRATGGIALALIRPGEQPPAEADIVLARCLPGDPLPPRCGAVVTVESLNDARLDSAGESVSVTVEAIAREQAVAIAALFNERAAGAWGYSRSHEPLLLAEVVSAALGGSSGSLPAVIGKDSGEIAVVDLVADGPHAVVAGVTGSGKSELLITWILALCAVHSTAQVNFLLADFKGGTAFDSLAALPHVTGVITDLDGTGARRALQSLRAEVRWREACIAEAGARDILDPRVELPRLVVVVDEFAALLGDHPELHAVFADVAARGRALGMHLILGTQRVAGVVRDSLLANCPLRICLRVTDGADSRAVVGVDDAAMLPGGANGRGLALVRRSADSHPRRVRIALSQAADIDAVRGADGPSPRRPWLPSLPSEIRLGELARTRGSTSGLLLGLADEPERQRQWPMTVDFDDRALLIVGGAGSGRSNALELLAAQATGRVVSCEFLLTPSKPGIASCRLPISELSRARWY